MEWIMTEIFPNFAKDINLQIEEAEWILNRIHSRKTLPRHIRVELLRSKKKKKHPQKTVWEKKKKYTLLVRTKPIKMTITNPESERPWRSGMTSSKFWKRRIEPQMQLPVKYLLGMMRNQDILSLKKKKNMLPAHL